MVRRGKKITRTLATDVAILHCSGFDACGRGARKAQLVRKHPLLGSPQTQPYVPGKHVFPIPGIGKLGPLMFAVLRFMKEVSR